ncbi:hypothetical protein RhiirA4_480471, partial [Rhizophagus irregularis]
HYYADVDKTRIEIKRLIKEGEWDTKEFIEMRKELLEQLQIKHNPFDNEVILEKLSVENKEILEKLSALGKLEKSFEELEKLLKK